MYSAICDLIDNGSFPVTERFDIPGRQARHDPRPRFLFDSRIGLYLSRQFKTGLWSHQVEALEALGRGENVVVSTGTASGKSLIFRSHVLHNTLLNPGSRSLIFYPLKALAADQIRGWNEMAHSLALDENIIGRIDGSVPVKDREDILNKARIVVMTPDVCHAWLMSRLSSHVVRKFVQSLSTIVMDEAHTLESVFGSNYAFLIRRLISARRYLRDDADQQPLQFIKVWKDWQWRPVASRENRKWKCCLVVRMCFPIVQVTMQRIANRSRKDSSPVNSKEWSPPLRWNWA